jgi:hypothetical protein
MSEDDDDDLRRCTVCGHLECEACQADDGFGWCDIILGEDADLCCDGECTYDPQKPPRLHG